MKERRHSTGSCRSTRTPAVGRGEGTPGGCRGHSPWGNLTWEVLGHFSEEGVGRPPGAVQGWQPHVQLEVVAQDLLRLGTVRLRCPSGTHIPILVRTRVPILLLLVHRVPEPVPLLPQRPDAPPQHPRPGPGAALPPPAAHGSVGTGSAPAGLGRGGAGTRGVSPERLSRRQHQVQAQLGRRDGQGPPQPRAGGRDVPQLHGAAAGTGCARPAPRRRGSQVPPAPSPKTHLRPPSCRGAAPSCPTAPAWAPWPPWPPTPRTAAPLLPPP